MHIKEEAMEQDRRILQPEDLPVLREEDSIQEQIRKLYDCIYKLHEQLRYILGGQGVEK